ncbi:hypothetical protein [Prochlorococcus sp. MIT 1011]|uniref:hypothetical protein n=1 Tax=Prochlorococcus sp. MIT 1011 TaxID=3082520 RepID=UPI0039B54FE2
MLIKLNLISKNNPLVMCYQFGKYNSDTLEIHNQLKIDYSLTTNNGSASFIENNSIYELKRWDTNDCWSEEWRKPTLPISK